MDSPSNLAGKRVLITGASGFTGRYVVAELKRQGCRVLGLAGHPERDDGWTRELAPADEYRQVDLRDIAALKNALEQSKPDVIIHLAALAFVAYGRAEDFYSVNLMGTRNLLQAIDEARIAPECVLIASSANIYGNSSAGLLDESVPPAPANDYAVSKLAMEYVVSLWKPRVPVIVVRPFNYTGVGQSANFLVPKIVEHFRRREPVIELGNLDVSRDFSDVRFVAKAYASLVGSPGAVGATLNVCSGTTHSLGDIIDMCAQITGHSIEVRVNPDFVRSNEVKRLQGDDAQLRRWVGALENPALRRTLEWMLEA